MPEDLKKDLNHLNEKSLTLPFYQDLATKTKEEAFSTPKELQAAISAYFKYCQDNYKHPTMNGLALSLGTTRHEILNFPSTNILAPVINAARQRISALVEESLLTTKNSSGAFSWLKNNDNWSDKSEIRQIKPLTAAEVIKQMRTNNITPQEAIEGYVEDDAGDDSDNNDV